MADLMEYKGYHAKVEYDPDDKLLVGKVFGISDSLNFHAKDVDELEEAFHTSIDGYLDFCTEIGKCPEKEYSGTFNVRVSPELHKQASLRAQKDGVALNRVVERALTEYLNPGNEMLERFDKHVASFEESIKNMSTNITITTDTYSYFISTSRNANCSMVVPSR